MASSAGDSSHPLQQALARWRARVRGWTPQRKDRPTWAALLSLCALPLLVAVSIGVASLNTPLRIGADGLRVDLRVGDTLAGQLLPALRRQGTLPSPRWLALYARLSGKDKLVQDGAYQLDFGSTPLDMLGQLTRGDAVLGQVRLQEGWTLRAALRHLQAQNGIRAVLVDLDAAALPFIDGDDHPEGLFFPDTYFYRLGATDRSVLRQAHRRMQSVLAEEWRERDALLPYDTPYQALILASIVERETGLASERAQIAGVFARRLQRGMRLETDPSVIYGLGARFQGDLRREHLRDRANPYNSYRHAGLPPTPIALPGRAAIRAAMRPASGDSLYFVARGDGSHAFSATFAQHTKAVRQYQFARPASYRSAPAPPARAANTSEDRP